MAAEGNLVQGEVTGDSYVHTPDVSRETGTDPGAAVAGHEIQTTRRARPSAGQSDPSDPTASPLASRATGWEPPGAAPRTADTEAEVVTRAEHNGQSSLDVNGVGDMGRRSAESAESVLQHPIDAPALPGNGPAIKPGAVDHAGPAAVSVSILGDTDRPGADRPEAADSAFSSAPRASSSRLPDERAASVVSRETAHTPGPAPAVGNADARAGVVGPDDAAVQLDLRGENEDVAGQPEAVYGVGHDDEARRAALVDSLPDAGDDTPLMAQIQADATRRIQLRGRKFPRPAQTRIITVANQKGGVGKTTTTVNLAAALAQSGLNVLVLDNDPQGNASTALGVAHHAGTPSIYEVLVDEAPMAGAVQECPDVPNLWCVPATIDLSGAEIELVSMVARETRLRTALDAYLAGRIAAGQEPIDYVFVDCPPSLGLLTVNAFVVGREVLIPIQCEYYALEGLTQLLKTIQLIQAHLNPGLHVSTILLTMYDARTNLAQQVAQEVRDHFPETTLRTSVPRSVRISEAPSYGQTVITYDAGSSGALAYLEAARELAERGAADTDAAIDGDGATSTISVDASGRDRMNHTNGTSGGSSSVVGSSVGSHQEEQ